ncbi:response regulator [Pedobacter sp. BS3]|uniref:response regulator n=1 Tax=Pedobacter sp. BS3 TaxID=2567937 RepID=UPI0011F0473B|nr:response regulator [Pedobacter sp. BS3]TZF84034.1 response regulator [Pedobacter sp. BS3]
MRKFTFQQQVLTGFGITLFFVFVLAIVSYLSIQKLQSDINWANRTEKIVTLSGNIQQYLVDAETGQRGYIITGSEAYLDIYNLSVNNVDPAILQLKSLLAGSNDQLVNVDSLQLYVSRKIAEMKYTIGLRNSAGFEAVQKRILQNHGKLYMDKVRSYIASIQAFENKKLIQRRSQSEAGVDRTLLVILSGSFIILCLILLLLSYIIRTFRQQKVIENQMRMANKNLRQVSEENRNKNWLLKGTSMLDESMRGELEVGEIATNVITRMAEYMNAKVAALYLANEAGDVLKLAASYAYSHKKMPVTYKIGEGLLGQAALEKKRIVLENVPENYIKVSSGLGDTRPGSIVLQPFLFNGNLKGVIELAFVEKVGTQSLKLLSIIADSIGISINAAQARVKMRDLFEQTQQQAEELETQQEELRTTNEELLQKTHLLQASEEELRVQQEELRQINAELEEKAELLEEQHKTVERAREAISAKARELEQTNKYKSEFMANMSHELRTPLNSILILARILKENKSNNLADEQVKYAGVIHNAGSDLLMLINDILDLSKIESGKLELTVEEVSLAEIRQELELLFSEVAKNKNITYEFHVDDAVPDTLISDRMRIEQIIKNLLSNSFKFTPENGRITVDIHLAGADINYYNPDLIQVADKQIVAISVSDTGIGISEDKQQVIFEAFRQADGSTSRQYGGTGLGLSISRQLALMLGGEIHVKSNLGEGSTFTLYLPVKAGTSLQQSAAANSLSQKDTVKQDALHKAATNKSEEHILLIVEDDEIFADILKSYALERGFKPILAHRGDIVVEMVLAQRPDAIVMDVMLPVMDGWEVLKALKANPETRHIPVHMMSAGDERAMQARQEGAIGFLKKPVNKESLENAFNLLSQSGRLNLNKVLLIEDHEVQSENLRQQLAENAAEVIQAFSGEEALQKLQGTGSIDCIILDLNLPDMSGLDLLDKIKADKQLAEIPIIINTAMELDEESLARVMQHTHAMVLKNNKSNERLLDEVNLFMHKIKAGTISTNPGKPHTGKSGKQVSTLEKALENKNVLIVDDDMRNIFALTSVLQEYNLNIEIATNGHEALKKLDEKPETDIILMDIMMPEMDGYEAIRELRKQKRFKKLPVIALTAKAMKNDREKCIEAGASDYITKPIDADMLLSMMRVWLS